jgi:hypothetical protein
MSHAGIMHPAVPALRNLLPANPAAAYRLRTAQSISVFGTALPCRISGTTGEQCRLDIREAAMNQSWNRPMLRWLCQNL